MIGKILSHLIGNAGEEEADDTYEELVELEEEGWVFVNLPENRLLSVPEVDPLENLLIEHPSMSVYQMRSRMSEPEEGELGDEENDDEGEEVASRLVHVLGEDEASSEVCSQPPVAAPSKPVPATLSVLMDESVAVTRHISWRLAAWGIPLPCNVHLLAIQRARTQAERKKLSRRSLHRQNLAKLRFSPAEKRYGHFKQPCQRLYNY